MGRGRGGGTFCAEINSEIVVESIPPPSTDKDFMDFGILESNPPPFFGFLFLLDKIFWNSLPPPPPHTLQKRRYVPECLVEIHACIVNKPATEIKS